MTHIKIPTIDGKICHLQQVILDIVQAVISRDPSITLDMVGEGPCLKSVGLYQLLDDICLRFKYSKKNFRIITANFLETHKEYKIIKRHQSYELITTKSMQPLPWQKQFAAKDFKHFGHFIGHGNRFRLQLASYLFNHQARNTLQTYHCKMTDAYHREHFGLEDMMFNGHHPEEIKDALNLILSSPLTIDNVSTYPILVPANLNITKVYPHFFLEIVNLTYFTGDVFYIDEKVWRPIIMRTPFMIQGPAYTIINMRKLGFKTFDHWWDEGYSEDPTDNQVAAIIHNIKQLAELNVHQLEHMYQDMQPTLNHNYDRLMTLTPADFAVI